MKTTPYTLTVLCNEQGDLALVLVDEKGKAETLSGLGTIEVLATPAGTSVRITKSKTAKNAVENLFEQLGAASEPMPRERSAYL